MQESTYKFGYGDHFQQIMRLRSAQKEAAFLLPYLQSNMTLLDCGCGLGNITCDFAKILSNGKVVGLDINAEQLERAHEEAKKRRLANIAFQAADILHLPFPDDTFDVVFSHAVIGQMSNTMNIIQEMLRVTKPGGIVAGRIIDFGSTLIYPAPSAVMEAHRFRMDMINQKGSDFYIGRALRSLFEQAGCKETIGTASCETYGTAEEVKLIANYFADELTLSPYGKEIAENHLYPEEEIQSYQRAWKDWATLPGAFMSFTWCEVMGFK